MTPPPAQALPEHQEDPDIVRVILDRVSVLIPEAQRPQLVELEQQVRTQYGGLRVRIPKRGKYPTPEQYKKIIATALGDSTRTNEELIREAGISRAQWYAILKRKTVQRG